MKTIKNIFVRGIKGIVFLLLLVLMVTQLDSALKLVKEDNLSTCYYDYPKDTFDVAFFGTSLVMYGVYPLELYRDYGMAAYNFATGNQSLLASYLLVKEVIRKDHPSLIVLDCGRAYTDEQTMDSPYIHYITDSMPYLNKNRIEMINQLAAEEEDKKPLFVPLIAYHSRWPEITYEDAIPQAKEMVYGARVTGRVTTSDAFEEPEITPGTMPDSPREIIEKTIQLCRDNDTEILLTTMPVLGKNDFFGQGGYNRRVSASRDVGQLAEKYGVKYVDYLSQSMSLGFDLEKDSYDGEHLNRWGCLKFNKLLGAYIKENFDIPDRRGTGGVYSKIDEDAAVYPISRMKDSLRTAHNYRDYVSVLQSDLHDEPVEDVMVFMALRGDTSGKWITKTQAELLRNAGVTENIKTFKSHGWLAVFDGGQKIYETTAEKLEQNMAEKGVSQIKDSSEAADTEEDEAGEGDDAAAKGSDQEAAPQTADSGNSSEDGEEYFPDYADWYSGSSGKLEYEITSGVIDEETGEVGNGATIIVNGKNYTAGRHGLQIAVFRKSTGELLDQCRIGIYSSDLYCTHDNH